jgi:ketosteroid isomerase-like protein
MRSFVAGLAAVALASTAVAADPAKGPPGASGGDAATARAFISEYLAAFDRRDAAAVGALIAPDADVVLITAERDATFVGFENLRPGLERFMQGLESRKSTVRDLRVKLLANGKVAVATLVLDLEGRYQGKPFASRGNRMTYVLEKRGGRWLMVSAHGSLPAAEGDDSAVTAGPDVEAIQALIEQARKADLGADRSFYERILTDDFSFGVSSGEWESKQSKLAYLGSDRHSLSSETISDLRVRVHGTAAIATFTVTADGTWMKEPFHVAAILTQTWVKEAGGWRLAATHGSRKVEAR